jgi:hypothetical protein
MIYTVLEKLKEARQYLNCLPSGIDPDPDIDEENPEDMSFFYGGLADKAIREAIEVLEKEETS